MDQIESKLEPVAGAGEYLTFTLGAEEYGIDILKVQEIRSYEGATAIANAPPFMKGVINLRGVIVPLLDLRLRFGIGEPTYDPFTIVVVLNLGVRVVGIVVDGVSDVVTLGPQQIQPLPELSTAIDVAYVRGLASLDEHMLILIDIEQLMLSPEMGLVDA
ncbi:chemotaxis protein CheW [Chitiniphilus purpureus]|uniref:Chemotaxis protein CheW n=1 Tax=Chitiniphilus purpureus TaxID=2981137 RepID=A0ABY6DI03_9NEIS|nr:chemotaxis protein CheW [Chitiniphilus sp. CD1]UXY13951.1 chemotaxis protein CheW [Chitiniphilus sp. CD1]